MEVDRLWVVADLFCEEVERVCVVADGLDEVELDDLTAEPPERVEVEPEDLVDAELEDEREELDLEEDEDPVEPLCEVVVVDLRV